MAVTWRGHTFWTEMRDRTDEFPGAQVKYWGKCSCGWVSTWRPNEDSATAAALNHAWRVTVAPRMHDPEVPGRMIQRKGETMSKQEFVQALRASA